MVAEPRFGSPDLNLGFATPPAMAAAAAASSAVGAGTLLTVGAGEVAMIDAINAWSARVDASLGMGIALPFVVGLAWLGLRLVKRRSAREAGAAGH